MRCTAFSRRRKRRRLSFRIFIMDFPPLPFAAPDPHDLESCTPGTRQYKMVCTGTSQYVHNVPYSIQGRTRNLKMVHTSTYQHGQFLWQYILVCTGMYCLVITHQESYRKCYITSFNLLLQKRTSERFHGKEGFYTASLHFPLFQTAPFRIATLGAICSEAIVWP